jgi:MFS family permease
MVGAALGGFVTAGGIMTITVAAPHIQEEFGWSLTMIMGVLGVGAVVTGLMGLLAGYLVDRIGPRLVAMIGAIVGAAGLMLVSLTTANTPWMWYAGHRSSRVSGFRP